MLFAHGFGCDQHVWRFVAPVEVGEYLSRHLRGSTFRQLGATGHCPHMSHPEETVAVIKEYLKREGARVDCRSGGWTNC